MVQWRTKAKVNATVLGLFGIIFPIFAVTPTIWYGNYIFNIEHEIAGTWTQTMTDYPSVNYAGKVTAKTAGIFSIGNPIDIEVRILQSDVENLTDYYSHVKFLGADKNTQEPLLTLSRSPDGGWIAKGQVVFIENDRIWMLLSPKTPSDRVFVLTENRAEQIIADNRHILTLGSAADTLDLNFNSFAAKATFVFGSFSILLLAPILTKIFVHEKKDESSSKQNDADDKDGTSKQ